MLTERILRLGLLEVSAQCGVESGKGVLGPDQIEGLELKRIASSSYLLMRTQGHSCPEGVARVAVAVKFISLTERHACQ